MPTYSEPNYLNDWLRWEEDDYHSREIVTALSGESMVMGEVAGKITKSTPTTGTAGGSNTGDGTCTGVTAGQDAVIGTYDLECTAVADASTGTGAIFKVANPDGNALPDAESGVAFANEQLNFTINDGASAYIVGDAFTIAVAAGSGKVVPINFSAVDGSQDAYGILIAAVDASAADKEGVAVVREAQIVASYLTWPGGATAGQKTAALAQLLAKGITQKTEA